MTFSKKNYVGEFRTGDDRNSRYVGVIYKVGKNQFVIVRHVPYSTTKTEFVSAVFPGSAFRKIGSWGGVPEYTSAV